MRTLKNIFWSVRQTLRRAAALPQYAEGVRRRRRERAAWIEHEAERLDRLRNPSKYLGR